MVRSGIAQIVASWHPEWEEVETERGNGREILPSRAEYFVFALNKVKSGPNRASNRIKMAKNCVKRG